CCWTARRNGRTWPPTSRPSSAAAVSCGGNAPAAGEARPDRDIAPLPTTLTRHPDNCVPLVCRLERSRETSSCPTRQGATRFPHTLGATRVLRVPALRSLLPLTPRSCAWRAPGRRRRLPC